MKPEERSSLQELQQNGASVEQLQLRHRVFVYGTLKRGQPNHNVMNMQNTGRYRLIGYARTDVSFPLIVTTRWNIPFLLYSPEHGQRIVGEVYDVDDRLLAWMDKFEGHPEVYSRERVRAHFLSSAEVNGDKAVSATAEEHDSAEEKSSTECWTYFLKSFPPELLRMDTLSKYDNHLSCKPYQPDKTLQGPDDIYEALRLQSLTIGAAETTT